MKKTFLLFLILSIFTNASTVNTTSIDNNKAVKESANLSSIKKDVSTNTTNPDSNKAAKELADLLSIKKEWIGLAKSIQTIAKNLDLLLTKIKNNKDKEKEAQLLKLVSENVNKIIEKISGLEKITTFSKEELIEKSKLTLLLPVSQFLKPLYEFQSVVKKQAEDILLSNNDIKNLAEKTQKKPLLFQFLDSKNPDTFFYEKLTNEELIIQLCLELEVLTGKILENIVSKK
ncbi:hypothetical protein K9M16_01960 [Candidatus Babeliales bacterium]|nr:hypothetical protein [Candidatus Babeliales bacterium]